MTHLGLVSAARRPRARAFARVGFDPDRGADRRASTAGELPVSRAGPGRADLREHRRASRSRADAGDARRVRRRLRRRRRADRRSRARATSRADRRHDRARAPQACRRRACSWSCSPGAAGLHPRAAGAAGAALLPGRDAGLRPRGRARDQARALHRRLRRSGAAAARGAAHASSNAFGCPILPMRLRERRARQDPINCCLVASVTVANTLAELCERIGADWSEIAPALKLDRRIGPHAYLAPASASPAAISSAISRRWCSIAEAQRHRCRRGAGLARQLGASQGLGRGRCCRTTVLTDKPDADDRGARASPTRKTPIRPRTRHRSRCSAHLRGMQVKVHDPVVPASRSPADDGRRRSAWPRRKAPMC